MRLIKMDFIYKTMEIIDKGGGKYQLLNHAGELMFQGTHEQCCLSRQNMISYEWGGNGYHSHGKTESRVIKNMKYKVLEELPTSALTTSLIYDLWSDDFGIVNYEVYLDKETGEMFLDVIMQNEEWTRKLFLIEIINQ